MINLLYWLLAIIMFGVLVMLHELGHFLAARATGVPVAEFAIGFGPKLFSRTGKKNGVIFSLRALPFGGYKGANIALLVELLVQILPCKHTVGLCILALHRGHGIAERCLPCLIVCCIHGGRICQGILRADRCDRPRQQTMDKEIPRDERETIMEVMPEYVASELVDLIEGCPGTTGYDAVVFYPAECKVLGATSQRWAVNETMHEVVLTKYSDLQCEKPVKASGTRCGCHQQENGVLWNRVDCGIDDWASSGVGEIAVAVLALVLLAVW